MCWRIICVQLRIILPAVVFNPTPCSNGAVTTCSSSAVETVKPSSQGTDHSKVIIDDLRFGSPIRLPESVIEFQPALFTANPLLHLAILPRNQAGLSGVDDFGALRASQFVGRWLGDEIVADHASRGSL